MKKLVLHLIGYVVAFGLVIFLKSVTCMVDDAEANRAIENQGFGDVKLHDTAPFTCWSDSLSREFTATNSLGKTAHGAVCCGLIAKGCTLRWD